MPQCSIGTMNKDCFSSALGLCNKSCANSDINFIEVYVGAWYIQAT